MDVTTAEIRYQRWVRIIQDCNDSGLSKKDYCQQHGIKEKTFYYYQRRIRAIIAVQAGKLTPPEGSFEVAACSVEQQDARPQIVKLRYPGMTQADSAMISFSANGKSFSVPESIPASFLAKLLEAACHDSH